MDLSDIDYARVLQPQPDGYDQAVFRAIKRRNGYLDGCVPATPRMLGPRTRIANWRAPSLRMVAPSGNDAHFAALERCSMQAAPVFFDCVSNLLDVYTGLELIDGTERSTLMHSPRFPGAWIIFTSISEDPVIGLRNIMHELMHTKLIVLGLGSYASFTDNGEEFLRNERKVLHHSIVNSYADTMQGYMSAPEGRPMANCIHGYASFLAAAATTLKFIAQDEARAAVRLAYVDMWAGRIDASWSAIAGGAQATAKGERLLLGLENWTREFQRDHREAVARFAGDMERETA